MPWVSTNSEDGFLLVIGMDALLVRQVFGLILFRVPTSIDLGSFAQTSLTSVVQPPISRWDNEASCGEGKNEKYSQMGNSHIVVELRI
ncbi:hypothetical protein LX36DRAFT_650496 [Colletotrichum falcatum]|nr:hypothetical protein LX36DRAFT_650496 [Colletotrichum falcatum]